MNIKLFKEELKKWDRSLGTSKREQGVWTPPAPQHPKKRREFFERLARGKEPIVYKKISWYRYIWRKFLTFIHI